MNGMNRYEWIQLLEMLTKTEPESTSFRADLAARAREIARAHFGNRIFVRGLIEFTNYCRNDCYYCGLRASNHCAARYRLTPEAVLACCREGHALGLRTFVLQGGEDSGWGTDAGGIALSDKALCQLVERIKAEFPDCAVTLSVGERPRETYRAWREAGADRYLLRHETADPAHYARLHPRSMRWEHRKQCLWDLKDLGYQVGAGFMVGTPGQTAETLAKDFLFLKELEPEMVGIGPFVPHHDTPFRRYPTGPVDLTTACLSLTRIMLPKVLLPATTALSTIDADGRERGILAGANVVMPNLSPPDAREKYELYDNMLSTSAESVEGMNNLASRMQRIGYRLDFGRGDHPSFRHDRKEL